MANLDKWSMFLHNITNSVQCLQLFSDQIRKAETIREEYIKESKYQQKDVLAGDVMRYIALTSEINDEISKIQDRYGDSLNESIEELLGFVASLVPGDDEYIKWIVDGIDLVLHTIEVNEKPYSLSCVFREFVFSSSFTALRNLQLAKDVEQAIVKLRYLRNKINTESNVGAK